jgi:hypothetical protein
MFEAASLTFNPGHPSMQIGLVLKKVQMPPCSLLGIMDSTMASFAGRTGKCGPFLKIYLKV